MKSPLLRRTPSIVSVIGVMWTASAGLEQAQAQIIIGSLPTATVVVKEADGTPVEGAIACIGTAIHLNGYGLETTNQNGSAFFDGVLPEGPATVIFTAGKDGRGAQAAVQYVGPATPLPMAEIQLPASQGGVTCPGGGSGSTGSLNDALQDLLQSLEVTSSELNAREIFQVKLILKRPPPAPIVVMLESSNPHLVKIPRQITVRTGEQTAAVRAEISGEVRRAETVTILGRLKSDPKQLIRGQLTIHPDSGRTLGGSRK